MNITAATAAARSNDAGDVKLDDVQISVVLGHWLPGTERQAPSNCYANDKKIAH